MTETAVRARFCPSPTGTPHVGLIRTALFNWAFARHHGGTLVFRIEDTDAARDSEESYQQLLEALRWLGIDWDEGPDAGGEYGPYRQSERRDIYADIARRLLEAGELYEAYSTNEEVEARRKAAGQDPKLGYDNFDRDLTEARREAFRAEGRKPVLRLRMPAEDLSWDDLVRGPITFPGGSVPDPVLVRANGDPLYTLTNPVDDALMRITHVLRGEDLLPSTPRQLALYAALRRIGVTDFTPEFGHLPYVMGEGNKKLSKRDPQSNLFNYRDRGFIPEGLLNYLALLGWSIADDRDVFSVQELVDAFEISKVSANPARFDAKKAEAINGTHVRALSAEDFVRRVIPYLVSAGVLPEQPSDEQLDRLRAIAPLVQERVTVLGDAAGLVRFLFVPEEEFAPEEDAATKALGPDAEPVLRAAIEALEPLSEWQAPAIEQALKDALVEKLGLKPRKAFAPVRVAVTGRTVSPPLYESMELLGRSTSLARLMRAVPGN
ncbi:glutamyl-tRNA synthetase [Amycolatopsis bartoniae]|uniref:Glutamate--tRNA ligase n=1 Tax=Amycolatopsis bartoniae TaxID=941986 RepID=A0A8H9MBD7_9PSEU|nr:glutamate--tRNA ligase [Amycolatopsis bartoniae]MBB2936078.1 glutamyl-tRNA synthetase [Amycolatopsis bartoniae]TVT03562.1 glutamate--tRNA ligase [Amycolatopsis bartoniae]GHF63974.1 glutamate--tRNA ligase [Amycolatopsis bartoniae]